MDKNLKPDRSGKSISVSVSSFHGNVSHQTGNIRSVMLGDRMINTNRIPYGAKEIQESIEETFGK